MVRFLFNGWKFSNIIGLFFFVLCRIASGKNLTKDIFSITNGKIFHEHFQQSSLQVLRACVIFADCSNGAQSHRWSFND